MWGGDVLQMVGFFIYLIRNEHNFNLKIIYFSLKTALL